MRATKKYTESIQFDVLVLAFIPLLCAITLIGILQTKPDRITMGYSPLLFLVWGIALFVLCGRKLPQATWLAIGLGLALRLLFFGQTPLLSDDVYRYLWEGWVINQGYNPLISSPAELSHLNPALQQWVNHPEIPSIYPPIALRWFQLMDATGGGLLAAQGFAILADAFILIGMHQILRGGKQAMWPIWMYALHPLAVVESGWSAHIDTLAVGFTVWAVYAYRHKANNVFATFLIVIGAGAKVFPALLVPKLMGHVTNWRAWTGLLLGSLTLFVCVWNFLNLGDDLFSAWRSFGLHWEFNGFIYPWLRVLLGQDTRLFLVGLSGLGVLLIWWRTSNPIEAWYWLGLLFVFASPTLHPWYAIWLLVPAALTHRRGTALACAFAMNSYAVLLGLSPDTGRWEEPIWLWWATWIPITAGVLFDARARNDDTD